MQEKKKARKICTWIVVLSISWSLVLTSSATTIIVENRLRGQLPTHAEKDDLPDLVIDDITLTWRVGSYRLHRTITYKIKNIGDKESGKSGWLKIEVKERYLFQPLHPNEWKWKKSSEIRHIPAHGSREWFIDRDGSLSGYLVVKGIVDPDNKVEELNESNNEFTSIWWTAPFPSFDFEIWNQKEGFDPFFKDSLPKLAELGLYILIILWDFIIPCTTQKIVQR